MSSQLYELLAKLKSTTFTNKEYDLVRQTATKQSKKAVNLWKFKPQIRILFKMGKFQSYMMFILGLTVLPYTLYYKYQQDKQKLTRILLFAPIALGACLGPIIMYKRFSKKLIQSVSYNFQNKKLLLTRFKDSLEMQIDVKDISVIKSQKGRVKELVLVRGINNNNVMGQDNVLSKQVNEKFQIQGLGEWQSLQMFNYIIMNSNQMNKQHL